MTSTILLVIVVVLAIMPFIKDPLLYFLLVTAQGILFVCLLFSLRGNGRKNTSPSLHEHVRSAIEPLGESVFDIILEDAGDRKIAVAKCLRQIYNLGLRDASLIIEHTPSVVKLAVSKQEADFVAARLAEYNATVKIVRKSK